MSKTVKIGFSILVILPFLLILIDAYWAAWASFVFLMLIVTALVLPVIITKMFRVKKEHVTYFGMAFLVIAGGFGALLSLPVELLKISRIKQKFCGEVVSYQHDYHHSKRGLSTYTTTFVLKDNEQQKTFRVPEKDKEIIEKSKICIVYTEDYKWSTYPIIVSKEVHH
ncbi:hypothetical protein SAMN05421749_102174 [Acinetobacter marinus]|uniref:DUF3592 domain-containing protein n=1 Tax=Acinetobacter marinus TaxID=281375 RepID=A0A1G6HF90_9GAMM|nr:hypothetical protein [Acinetobacter marinus]SDB92909.1 hypothetical protein SAMN05421749_102174 [Acinetobacter marinus]